MEANFLSSRPLSPAAQIISVIDIIKPSSLEAFKEVYRPSPPSPLPYSVSLRVES